MSVVIGRHKLSDNYELKGICSGFHKEITEDVTVVDVNEDPTMPWVRISAVVDGPDPVYFGINTEEPSEVPHNKGDVCRLDTGRPLISIVSMKCALGETSWVRLEALK